MFRVTWETLNGNVLHRDFETGPEADEFSDRKSEQLGVQWVDVECID